ncbi:MAG: ribbon-helix-helix domain-containing protein [Cyanosarcina radialis HA8281-LM2]|nr:ribbon-helix-helix domain-containing protein [Cyanosarcina radialis HA8281-LM2]
MAQKDLHIRLSVDEMKRLDRYCRRTKRTKTDVIRELVRQLPSSGVSNPIARRGESIYPAADLSGIPGDL